MPAKAEGSPGRQQLVGHGTIVVKQDGIGVGLARPGCARPRPSVGRSDPAASGDGAPPAWGEGSSASICLATAAAAVTERRRSLNYQAPAALYAAATAQ